MLDIAYLIIGAMFLLLFTVEILSPRDKVKKSVNKQSYKSNLELFIINGIFLSSILIFFPLSDILPKNQEYGIVQIGLSFIIIDLVLYAWHLLAHKVDLLWFMHRVHHNDKVVNTTTSFRVHPTELFVLNIIKLICGMILSLDQQLLAFNEILMTGFIMFHHSNIKLKFEKWLSYVFIVPSLHKIHHLSDRSEHDSNYGTVFSIWDRIFGTLKETGKSEIGLTYDSPQNSVGLLKYGMSSVIEPVKMVQPKVYTHPFDEMVAKAAYYKAQARNFAPGDDQYDWFEAEREIRQMLNA